MSARLSINFWIKHHGGLSWCSIWQVEYVLQCNHYSKCMDQIRCTCNMTVFDNYSKEIPLKTSRRLLLSNFISAPLHRTVGCLLLRWLKILATSSLRRYSTANNAEHLITSTKKNLYPQSSDKWNNLGKFSHKFYFRASPFCFTWTHTSGVVLG